MADSKPTSRTRHERIIVLLENYIDVESGMRDRRGDGEHIPLMCAAWNHPSYVELDRLLGIMRSERSHIYWHLSMTYFYAPQRRVLQCPRCKGIMPSWHSKNFHKHGHSNVAVAPRVVRMVREGVLNAYVTQAVMWLDERWTLSDVFLPDELLPLVA